MEEREQMQAYGGSRTAELETFATASLQGLSPGKRRELREFDLTDEAKVTEWAATYEITVETLGR